MQSYIITPATGNSEDYEFIGNQYLVSGVREKMVFNWKTGDSARKEIHLNGLKILEELPGDPKIWKYPTRYAITNEDYQKMVEAKKYQSLRYYRFAIMVQRPVEITDVLRKMARHQPLPEIVIRSIITFLSDSPGKTNDDLGEFSYGYSGDHWYIRDKQGVYTGIEQDGYTHQ